MLMTEIYRHACATPAKLAVVNSGEEISYSRFVRMIDKLRRYLIECPLPANGVIAEIGSDLLQRWVMLLALRSLGRTTVSGKTLEMIESLELPHIDAIMCFADDKRAREALAAQSLDCPVIVIPADIFHGLNEDYPLLPPADAEFGDHILCTSGTTGRYKKVVLRGASTADAIKHNSAMTLNEISPASIYNNVDFGPWTIAGYVGPLAPWYFGATVIFEQRVNPADYFFDYPVTMAVLLSPFLRELCERHPNPPANSARCSVITGGGFINADLAVRASRQLNCDLIVRYGGTEFRPALEQRVEADEDAVWLTPLEGPRFEIVDEDGVPLPRGEEGVVRIASGPADPTEYLDDPEATARHFRDGYFYPGDMAVQRQDGKVRILGRVDDVLTIGAQKLAIEPFEERTRQFLGVSSLCLFVQQSAAGKDELLVVIEGDAMPDPEKVRGLAASTSKHFALARFALLRQFPRGENGMAKIQRREVLRLVNQMERRDFRLGSDGQPAA
jgi:acyl-coenzyme A synthetase/AMP-(fatty) acid ligase